MDTPSKKLYVRHPALPPNRFLYVFSSRVGLQRPKAVVVTCVESFVVTAPELVASSAQQVAVVLSLNSLLVFINQILL